jgi:hypothetical protein
MIIKRFVNYLYDNLNIQNKKINSIPSLFLSIYIFQIYFFIIYRLFNKIMVKSQKYHHFKNRIILINLEIIDFI